MSMERLSASDINGVAAAQLKWLSEHLNKRYHGAGEAE